METPDIKVEWDPKKFTEGEKSTIEIHLEIPEGIHIQAHKPAEDLLIPTNISLKDSGNVSFGQPVYPEPKRLPVSWSQVTLLVYEGLVNIQFPIQVAKNAKVGKHTIEGRLSFQGCTDQLCLPPKEQVFVLDTEII